MLRRKALRRRVVVTGLGVITPIGIGKEAFWEGIKEGRSGIGKITRFDASSYPSQIAGEIRGFDPKDYMSPRQVRRMDRFAHLAIACARMAMDDSGFLVSQTNANRVGIVMGSAMGGMELAESQHSLFMEKGLRRVSPFLAIGLFPGASSSYIAIELGINGLNLTISTACASFSRG